MCVEYGKTPVGKGLIKVGQSECTSLGSYHINHYKYSNMFACGYIKVPNSTRISYASIIYWVCDPLTPTKPLHIVLAKKVAQRYV